MSINFNCSAFSLHLVHATKVFCSCEADGAKIPYCFFVCSAEETGKFFMVTLLLPFFIQNLNLKNR